MLTEISVPPNLHSTVALNLPGSPALPTLVRTLSRKSAAKPDLIPLLRLLGIAETQQIQNFSDTVQRRGSLITSRRKVEEARAEKCLPSVSLMIPLNKSVEDKQIQRFLARKESPRGDHLRRPSLFVYCLQNC